MVVIVNTLPRNYIFEDIVSIFRPLNFLQYFYFIPKFKIKRNFVYPTSIAFKILSTCFLICSIAISVFSHTTSSKWYINDCPTSKLLSYASFYGTVFAILLNMIGVLASFKTNVLHSSINVKLLISIQRISMPFLDKVVLKKGIIFNWLFSVIILVYHLLNLFKYYLFWANITRALNEYVVQPFDINIIYVTCTMKIIRNNLESWMLRVESNQFPGMSWKKMYRIYLEIIDAYELNKQCFERVVS